RERSELVMAPLHAMARSEMKRAMRWTLWTIIATILMAIGATGQTTRSEGQRARESLLVTGAKILDQAGERWLEGQVLLVTGGTIEAIGPRDGIVLPDRLRELDLSGCHLIPGLIDLHSHLLLHPY